MKDEVRRQHQRWSLRITYTHTTSEEGIKVKHTEDIKDILFAELFLMLKGYRSILF